MGADAYQQGVAAYFKAFAWRNATRAQFMDAIAQASGTDLGDWTEAWLKTEGLAQMVMDITCDDDRIQRLSIRQTAVNATRLSPHRTQAALIYLNASGKLERREVLAVDYAEALTDVPDLVGKPCPDFIDPNFGDMDYGLFFLDPRSYDTIMNHLSALEEPFQRRMVWGTLYAMVRHEKLRASDFMALILANLPTEHDLGVLEYLLGGRVINETLFNFLAPEHRPDFANATRGNSDGRARQGPGRLR